jgi:hypothetical protein
MRLLGGVTTIRVPDWFAMFLVGVSLWFVGYRLWRRWKSGRAYAQWRVTKRRLTR